MVTRRPNAGFHRFGGDWTTRKLEIVAGYLQAYTTALKKQPFEKVYIDAFAGSGYRVGRQRTLTDKQPAEMLFPELAAQEPQQLLAGSAKRALAVEPPFGRYIFIERNQTRRGELEALKSEFPSLGDRIQIEGGDANRKLRDLCGGEWASRRAVLFLDPYGMQVEWAIIEAVARTKAIDLWLLFPLGMGVNRLLPRSAEIPDSWRQRLDLVLGTTDWYDKFYTVDAVPNLFDEQDEQVRKVSMDRIGQYFLERLGGVFSGVLERPAVLRNSTNNPLYLLCFAAGNPKGTSIALKIARHLLKLNS